jgi:hypothetical protein
MAVDVVNADALEAAIEGCFDRSGDSTVPAPVQAQFRAAARRLREQLVRLESARFREGTPELVAANGAVREANGALQKDLSKLEDLTKTVEQVQAAVAKLDQVIALAGKVV